MDDLRAIEMELMVDRVTDFAIRLGLDEAEFAAAIWMPIKQWRSLRANPNDPALTIEAEERIRRFIALFEVLTKRADTEGLSNWLRQKGDDGITPLAFLISDQDALRKFRNAFLREEMVV